MILGALAVSTAVATEGENAQTNQTLLRECNRYGLEYERVLRSYSGIEAGNRDERRGWWDYAIVAAAVGVFITLGMNARAPELGMNVAWLWVMAAVLVVTAVGCGWGLWKVTRFS
jgi:hypothetical protein